MRKILCVLALLVCCVLLLTIPALAIESSGEYDDDGYPVVDYGDTTGQCGDHATWLVEGDVLTISGVGKIWDYPSSSQVPWRYYRESIKRVVVCGDITELGHRAFNELSALEEVELGDSVVTLGSELFRFCSSLKSVKLSNQLKTVGRAAFLGCRSLEQITLPDSLETIDREGFAVCEKLKEISIPRNVNTIGPYAFIYCTSLEVIHFEGDVPKINKAAFDDITVTVTYPWLNTTWTNEALKNYGGKITWQHRECKGEHTFWEWERISEPTTESTGLEKGVCSNCGLVEERVIPKFPIPSSSTVTTPTPPVTQPTVPTDSGKVTVHPRLFSNEAIWACGVIAAIFVVSSIIIFIRIAVLTQQEKRGNENEI